MGKYSSFYPASDALYRGNLFSSECFDNSMSLSSGSAEEHDGQRSVPDLHLGTPFAIDVPANPTGFEGKYMLECNDELFVTVVKLRKTIVDIHLSGCQSFADITEMLRKSLSLPAGVYGIMVRNRTKGWRTKKVVVARNTAA